VVVVFVESSIIIPPVLLKALTPVKTCGVVDVPPDNCASPEPPPLSAVNC
jgi:hypothetical protein